jgi:geranylgeranyl pyrophosphate synthase
MATHAIPGLAFPLVRDGCELTEVDLDWVRQASYLKSSQPWLGRIDIDLLRLEVDGWFHPEALAKAMGHEGTRTEDVALAWLARAGKRWRPLLGICVYQVLSNTVNTSVPEATKQIALAMECFHKASLIHDDIEDADILRYGELTLHQQQGIPIALNVGDYLLGLGYRLVGRWGGTPAQVARMLAVAAEGHCVLCLGQGEELAWMRAPKPLSVRQVLDLFRRKTAPAFEVALHLGAIAAGADEEISRVLRAFSESLGIAYQVKDDLEDIDSPQGDFVARRPSILFALAWEAAEEPRKAQIEAAWCQPPTELAPEIDPRVFLPPLKVEEKARQLLEHYKNEAVRSLSPLRNSQLKTLLRRLVGRILGA